MVVRLWRRSLARTSIPEAGRALRKGSSMFVPEGSSNRDRTLIAGG